MIATVINKAFCQSSSRECDQFYDLKNTSQADIQTRDPYHMTKQMNHSSIGILGMAIIEDEDVGI